MGVSPLPLGECMGVSPLPLGEWGMMLRDVFKSHLSTNLGSPKLSFKIKILVIFTKHQCFIMPYQVVSLIDDRLSFQ